MRIFKRKTNALARAKRNPVIVSVPDIKDYLVREYERVNLLKLENEDLKIKLEDAEEISLKYKAALVTLDEYSKRLDKAQEDIAKANKGEECARAAAKLKRYCRNFRQTGNSYKRGIRKMPKDRGI